jgi:predicted acetyltransferase
MKVEHRSHHRNKLDKLPPVFHGVRPMIELLEVRPDDLSGGLASAVYRLLRDAWPEDGPNEGDYYRKLGPPAVAIVLRDGPQVCGHLGLYTREVEIGNETLEIGMLGGVVVVPDRRRRGYSRLLVRHAHEYLKERRIPFSILMAYEPRIYEGSGYKLMQNATRFIEPDGTAATFVYRGSMYAELSQKRWPNQLLDLRGPTV